MRARSRPDEELIAVDVRLPRGLVEETVLAAHRYAGGDDRRVALARLILAGYRRRRALLPGVRLGEPGWAMALDLYTAAHAGKPVDVSGLCLASGAAPTTALRRLEWLAGAGAVHRRPDPRDRRRTWVEIDAAFGEAIGRWLDLQLAALATLPGGPRGSGAAAG